MKGETGVDYFKKADRVIKGLIRNGKSKFIIFPFGERGILIKQILNQRYGIQEEYIVDNLLSTVSKNKMVISLTELQEKILKA